MEEEVLEDQRQLINEDSFKDTPHTKVSPLILPKSLVVTNQRSQFDAPSPAHKICTHIHAQ